QALAFTARTVRADEQRKYINSPETPSYIKGRVIFALDLARDEITRRGHAVLMEGQFDVITSHHFGVTNAVASSGTAMTDDQVRLLKRFTDELLLVFDWIRQFPEGLRDGYAEAAERHTGISRHLLLRDPEPAPIPRPTNGLAGRVAGKKLSAGSYLVQLLAVRPAAFERVRPMLTPQEL